MSNAYFKKTLQVSGVNFMYEDKKNNITLNFNSRRAITAVAECFKEYLGKMHKDAHFRSRNAGRIP